MVVKVGHRGAAGHEPENTLRSFRKALDLGADMVELDVHLCGTGELVVIHDETVDRTTDGSGSVRDMPFHELRGLDAGKGERIPTLREVLDLLEGRAGVNIELKGPEYRRTGPRGDQRRHRETGLEPRKHLGHIVPSGRVDGIERAVR